MELILNKSNVRKELRKLKRSGQWKRLEKTLMKVADEPYVGAEKAMFARRSDEPVWIKRLDYFNRVLYTIDKEARQVTVISIGGHYSNMGTVGVLAS